MRLKQAFASRLRRWASRRHGVDSLPHIVQRRRIYIVPTRFGAMLSLMLVAMLVAGLNYGSNLALGFAFLLSSLAIVAMHHCHRNLLQLIVDAPADGDAIAGAVAQLCFTLRSETGYDRFDLELLCDAAEPVVFHLAGTATAYVEAALPCPRRGVIGIAQWELRTRHPFGWFRAWTYVQAPLRVFVAPAPAGALRAPADAGGGDACHPVRGGDDEFDGLREYRPGDALKHMAWKVIARGQAPAVRQYSAPRSETSWLDYHALEGLSPEARLSQLCRWVMERDARGAPYGLRLPGTQIAPAAGAAHRRACLRALAGFTP